MVYLTSEVDFFTLIKDTHGFHAMEHCSKAIDLTLLYNPMGPHKLGAFKQASLGCTDQPVLGDSKLVMVKQCFYKGLVDEVIPFDNHTQITMLSMEINCLRWSSALMCLTYDYIDGHIKNHGPAPFAIPRMCFMKVLLQLFMIPVILFYWRRLLMKIPREVLSNILVTVQLNHWIILKVRNLTKRGSYAFVSIYNTT
jgi:hypothetical protein